jgi:hypothetical protein
MNTPAQPVHERGNFKVMIACCAWGNCSRCNADGNKSLRKWWGISDNLSEESAQHVAKAWRNYDAYVEPMNAEDFQRRAAAEEFFARNKPAPPTPKEEER